jgi:hypothetical protein
LLATGGGRAAHPQIDAAVKLSWLFWPKEEKRRQQAALRAKAANAGENEIWLRLCSVISAIKSAEADAKDPYGSKKRFKINHLAGTL